ncbi:uncharacterized protein BKA55DRAFT_539747 [Fusarium redolens]|uniref:Uncharacterized protein n=1 Tax=Fusarium redolens TaxID=48865 RepID=A0A9P9KAJ1_FUSRE|nr:uncharacterized protein BKA55DRAFT_539747 [Fusarium redolens]KAH7250185.1 hypothetical protein BKA55DRAFT_539747 [Fusarium redolens]
MRLFLSFVSLLSLATANPVSRSPRNKEGEYSWECGMNAPYAYYSDCKYLLGWYQTISKTGWFGIGKAKSLSKYWGNCQISIESGPLGHFALEIQQDQFVDVIKQGMMYRCPDRWSRIMVKPDNNTWTAYLTEKGWDPEQGF